MHIICFKDYLFTELRRYLDSKEISDQISIIAVSFFGEMDLEESKFWVLSFTSPLDRSHSKDFETYIIKKNIKHKKVQLRKFIEIWKVKVRAVNAAPSRFYVLSHFRANSNQVQLFFYPSIFQLIFVVEL